MIRTVEELAAAIADAQQRNDLAALESLQRYFEAADTPPPLPLMPAVAFNEAAFADPTAHLESEQAIPMANALSRAMRLVAFRLKLAGGYQGPILVAEGDSWFEFPILLDDVLDHLSRPYAVLSLAGAGHHLADMVAMDEFTDAIVAQNAAFFLLSGGGNDMLGGGRLRDFLHPFAAGMDAATALNRPMFDAFLQLTTTTLRALVARLTQRFPALTVLAHGYDYPVPRENGQALGGPLAERGMPAELWKPVAALLIDAFNEMLHGLQAEFPGRFFHIDCRSTVGAQQNRWFDELHPKSPGYGRAAQKFIERIELQRAAAPLPAAVAPAVPGMAAVESTARLVPRQRSSPSLPEVTRAVSLPRQSAVRLAPGGLGRPEQATAISVARKAAQSASPADAAALSAESIASAASAAPVSSDRRISKSPIDRLVAEMAESRPTLDAAPDANMAALEAALAISTFDIVPLAHTEQIIDSPLGQILDQAPVPPLPPFAPQPAAPAAPAAAAPSPCDADIWRARLDAEDHRAWQHVQELLRELAQPESAENERARLELTPAHDLDALERIVGESNLYQINYFARGERAARAVGRVSVVNQFSIPMGYGTGFLVAPGLLLTNHHVLTDAAIARHSHVVFGYEYDADNGLKQTERFEFTREIFVTSLTHDFAFVSVAPMARSGKALSDFGALKLIRDSGKALKREFVSIIQHASALPKQVAIRDSEVMGRKEQFIYYVSDTLAGSSGSPVLNDEWFPVALHHRAVPNVEKPCSYVANRGIRISAIFEELDRLAQQDPQARRVLALLEPGDVGESADGRDGVGASVPTGTRVVTPPPAGGDETLEGMKVPFHEGGLEQRTGYNQDFLGARVPLPTLTTPAVAALPIGAAEPLLHYEHFSLVMHKQRRLALYTAANVDLSPAARQPEPGKLYTRRALGGLGEGDSEKWYIDPRLELGHQLADRFFSKDGGAFDKGHIVRRDDMCWGHSYDQVRRANGDTFCLTNCSPQVDKFNQASRNGLWGHLEELVFDEVGAERCSLFAGPLLQATDRSFAGKDHTGDVQVQIPSKFWKVVVVDAPDGQVQAFAFLLEQDLSEVQLEFAVDAVWRQRMVTLAALEAMIGALRFPELLHRGDQARTPQGRALRAANHLELVE